MSSLLKSSLHKNPKLFSPLITHSRRFTHQKGKFFYTAPNDEIIELDRFAEPDEALVRLEEDMSHLETDFRRDSQVNDKKHLYSLHSPRRRKYAPFFNVLRLQHELNLQTKYDMRNPANVINPVIEPSMHSVPYARNLELFFVHRMLMVFSELPVVHSAEDAHKHRKAKPVFEQDVLETVQVANDLNAFTSKVATAFVRFSIRRHQNAIASKFLAQYMANPKNRMHMDKWVMHAMMQVHMNAQNCHQVVLELKRYLNHEYEHERLPPTVWRALYSFTHKQKSSALTRLLIEHWDDYKLDLGTNLDALAHAAYFFKKEGETKLYQEVLQMPFYSKDIYHMRNEHHYLRALEFITEKEPDEAVNFFGERCMQSPTQRFLMVAGLVACARAQRWSEGIQVLDFFYPEVADARSEPYDELMQRFSARLPSIDANALPPLVSICAHLGDDSWYNLLEALIVSFGRVYKQDTLESLYEELLNTPSPVIVPVFRMLFWYTEGEDLGPSSRKVEKILLTRAILNEYLEVLVRLVHEFPVRAQELHKEIAFHVDRILTKPNVYANAQTVEILEAWVGMDLGDAADEKHVQERAQKYLQSMR